MAEGSDFTDGKMEVTTDNPIMSMGTNISTEQQDSQIPTEQNSELVERIPVQDAGQAVMQRLTEVAITSRSMGDRRIAQSEHNTVSTSEKQVAESNQVNVTGGNYNNPVFGSKDFNLTRQEGVVSSDLRHAHLGNTFIQTQYVVTPEKDDSRSRQGKKPKKSKGRKKKESPDDSSDSKSEGYIEDGRSRRGKKSKKSKGRKKKESSDDSSDSENKEDSRSRRGKKSKKSKGRRKKKSSGDDSDSENEEVVILSPNIKMYRSRKLSKKKGHIYEGEMTSPIYERRIVAIKFIVHTPKHVEEAKILLKLTPHTNVSSIIHSDLCAEGPIKYMYIVMEKCGTQNLADYMDDRKRKGVPFNIELALKHSLQLVEAIEHIHKNDVVHRDLKPGNILFSFCKKYIKIVDFGLSKELINGRTVTGVSTLEPDTDGYRAPETYNKNIISRLADIFSLALVMFFLWSYGQHPFGDDMHLWNFNIKKGKGLDLSRLLVPGSDMAKTLLKKMLEFEPISRPKIKEILNDEYFRLDICQQLIESLNQVWNGTVKYLQAPNPTLYINGSIYQTPQDNGNENENEVLDGQNWSQTFAMKLIPQLDIGDIRRYTGTSPSGYFITSSYQEIKEVTEKIAKNNQMAWIDISSKKQNENKVLLLLCNSDYPELYGFLIPDQNYFLSRIQEIIMNQRTIKGGSKGNDAEVAAAISAFEALKSQKTQPAESQQSTVPASQAEQRMVESVTDDIADNTTSTTVEQSDQDRFQSSRNVQLGSCRDMIPWWFLHDVESMQK
ncbi:uncharacterized protein LOC120347754 isoform X1 [Styela clava]